TTAQNPEAGGLMRYEYDENSNLRHRISPANVTTNFVYDELDRTFRRSYDDGTPEVTYTYEDNAVSNSTGRLTRINSLVSTTLYTQYDSLGRITQSRQTTDGQAYSMAYSYNLADLLVSETYPSGRVVGTVYDGAGRPGVVLDAGRVYASNISYSPHGAITDLRFGNGLWENVQYNLRLQPRYMQLGTSRGAFDVWQLQNGFGGSVNNGNIGAQV